MIAFYISLGIVAYFLARLIWIVRSLNKLHIAFAAIGLNDLALMYVSGDLIGIMKYKNPWAEDIRNLIEDCGDRIRLAFLNPFFPWSKYRLLPTLDTALHLKRQVDMGAATFNEKEYLERAKAFQEQLKELAEED